MKKEGSQLKVGIVLNYLNMILGTLIPFFYTRVMLELLGQNEYGLFQLSNSFTSYLSLISLGLGSAVTRYMMKAKTTQGKEAEEKMMGLFVTVFRVIAIIALIIGSLLTLSVHIWYGDSLTATEISRMRIIVFITVCNTAISFAGTPYLSAVNVHEKYIFQQIMNIITTCSLPIINLIVLCLGFKSVGMAIVSLALGVATRAVYLFYTRKALELKPNVKDADFSIFKEIIVFSIWIFVSNIVNQLYSTTDTVIIGAIPALATTGVAIYHVGNTFNGMISTATIGISSLISPRTNRMVFEGATNEQLTDLAIKIGRLQGYIAGLITMGFVSFGAPFIDFYAGPEYKEAYWVAVVMMIPNMIPLVQSVCLNIIVAKNKHRFRAIVYLFMAILNVIGSYFAVLHIGIFGAALMTGISLVLGQGITMNIYYHKKIGFNIIRFWKEVAVVYIIPVILCIITLGTSLFINYYNLPVMCAGIVVFTAVYAVLTIGFVFNKYEKELLIAPVLNIISKLKK